MLFYLIPIPNAKVRQKSKSKKGKKAESLVEKSETSFFINFGDRVRAKSPKDFWRIYQTQIGRRTKDYQLLDW